jgi:hypothetical protein
MEENEMNKRIILITIPILLVALILMAAAPVVEDVKPMVTYTAKEQMCKVSKAGTDKDVGEGWHKVWGEVKVCKDTSADPLVAGDITLKTVVGWYDTTRNNYGWTVYESKLVTDHGTWKGYRIASTDIKGVTYTNGKAWGSGALGNRPTSNGWQMWYKMTDESPAIIGGKYTAEFEE